MASADWVRRSSSSSSRPCRSGTTPWSAAKSMKASGGYRPKQFQCQSFCRFVDNRKRLEDSSLGGLHKCRWQFDIHGLHVHAASLHRIGHCEGDTKLLDIERPVTVMVAGYVLPQYCPSSRVDRRPSGNDKHQVPECRSAEDRVKQLDALSPVRKICPHIGSVTG
jgi:hypothetical protein